MNSPETPIGITPETPIGITDITSIVSGFSDESNNILLENNYFLLYLLKKNKLLKLELNWYEISFNLLENSKIIIILKWNTVSIKSIISQNEFWKDDILRLIKNWKKPWSNEWNKSASNFIRSLDLQSIFS